LISKACSFLSSLTASTLAPFNSNWPFTSGS
jgi:hypothetical protein